MRPWRHVIHFGNYSAKCECCGIAGILHFEFHRAGETRKFGTNFFIEFGIKSENSVECAIKLKSIKWFDVVRVKNFSSFQIDFGYIYMAGCRAHVVRSTLKNLVECVSGLPDLLLLFTVFYVTTETSFLSIGCAIVCFPIAI